MPGERTLAYAFYALGVQFGQPLQAYNYDLIDYLGWSATFQLLSVVSFAILVVSFLTFDEPERGRFDVIHSVIANDSERAHTLNGREVNVPIGYDLSERTQQRVSINRDPDFS